MNKSQSDYQSWFKNSNKHHNVLILCWAPCSTSFSVAREAKPRYCCTAVVKFLVVQSAPKSNWHDCGSVVPDKEPAIQHRLRLRSFRFNRIWLSALPVPFDLASLAIAVQVAITNGPDRRQ